MNGVVRQAGFSESTLPRSNGSLVFEAPWQARAVALAVLVVENRGLEWEAFRTHLIAAIGEENTRPYWDSWVIALDRLLGEQGLRGGLPPWEPTS